MTLEPQTLATPTVPPTAVKIRKRTLTLDHPQGPLVVDMWEPLQPTENVPILLVHGWGGSGSYWQLTAQALGKSTQVIVPDLLGTGRSQPVRKAQNMFDQVESLAFILDHFKIDRVQLVGHSMGSAMALLLTEAYPERIDRLILTSLCFFMTETEAQIFKAAMFMFRFAFGFRHTRLAALPMFSKMMARRYFYRVPKDNKLVQQGFVDFMELDAATAIACANNATSPAIEAAGAKIQIPTLLIPCRQDQVMPVANVGYTASIIPNCQIRWIDKCGHLPMVEKPQEYHTIVRDFLQLD
ncbi:MAG: alpha/beta hydrolase [Chloroflexi bacterium]|nr:alpha/beta hydrolase [Chloroflexota bacterium]